MSQKLNVMIDSQRIATVAAALLYLADQADLSITLSGTPDEVAARIKEIETLLSHSRYSKPTFVLAVGGDFFHSMRGATWRMSSGYTEGYAFKLHDFGFRGEGLTTVYKNGELTEAGKKVLEGYEKF